MKAKKKAVHHRNGNALDNRKENLQVVSVKPEEVYQVDMEIPLRGPGVMAPIEGWGWARNHYTGEEAMCRSIGDRLKSQGCGGRLLRLDGTPEGELVEQWASIGRLEWASAQEALVEKKGII